MRAVYTNPTKYTREVKDMSYANVINYFKRVNLGDRVVVREKIGDTVEHAAEAIGCKPAQIGKTMSFIQNGNPVLIVMAGDAKVDNTKYKSLFHQKAIMIPGDQVETLTGHIPGAVCPFAINEGVQVYLDISLKRFDVIHTAGGSLNSTVQLSLEELERSNRLNIMYLYIPVQLSLEELEHYSNHSGWIDICKGWYSNENE